MRSRMKTYYHSVTSVMMTFTQRNGINDSNLRATGIKKNGNTPRSKKIEKYYVYVDRRGRLRLGEFLQLYAQRGEENGVMKKETWRKRIKESLIGQLRAKGSDIDLFVDQINDYMTLWDLKEKLKADIEEVGLRIDYVTANGTEMSRDNGSVKQLPVVNKQMLMLLKQLGVSTDVVIKVGEDDDAL